jgi:hypothetical protein
MLKGFQNNLMGNINNAIGMAKQPVYGDAQKADYLGGLDQLAKTSLQSLQANLARSGALNSGRMSQGATDINMGRNASAADFFSKIPMLNRNATMAALPGLFGAGNSLLATATRSQQNNSSYTGTSTGTGYQQQSYNPSIMSDIGQVAGIAGSLMGMPMMGGMGGGMGGGGMMQNTGIAGGANQFMDPWLNTQPMMPPPFMGGGFGGTFN